MEFQDKQLRCVDCGVEFVWTASEQLCLRGQALQERTQTVQGLQGHTGEPVGHGDIGAPAGRDPHHLLGVWQGDNGTVQTDAGPPGILSGVLRAAQDRCGIGVSDRTLTEPAGKHARAWPLGSFLLLVQAAKNPAGA